MAWTNSGIDYGVIFSIIHSIVPCGSLPRDIYSVIEKKGMAVFIHPFDYSYCNECNAYIHISSWHTNREIFTRRIFSSFSSRC